MAADKVKKFDAGGLATIFNPGASLAATAANFFINKLFGGGSNVKPLTPKEKVVQGLEYLANQQNELRTSGPNQDMQEGSLEAMSGNEETLKSLINEGMALGMTQAQLNPAISSAIGSIPVTKVPPQETSALMDLVREAGGRVVEGTADLGNLVVQAATLGQGPKLEAVIPNILDIIRGNIGGTLVFGGGQTPVPVLGTGQTGIGADTIVGSPNIPVIGPVINQAVSIIQQGGTLADVMRSIPDSLINNVPEVLSGVAAAGLLFDEKDKDTLVNLGVDPVIIKTQDDKTGGGADTPEPEGPKIGGVDTPQPEPPKTGGVGIPEPEAPKTGGVGIPEPEAPKIGGVGISEPEIVEAGLTPIDNPFKGEEEVKTSTPPAGGGVGGIGQMPTGSGVRTVSGGPGDVVEIPYFYDMAGSLAQPFIKDEDEEDLRNFIFANGGKVKKFNPGGGVNDDYDYLKTVGGYSYDTPSGLSGSAGDSSGSSSSTGFNIFDKIIENPKLSGLVGGALGGLFGLAGGPGDTSGSQGYTGGIPDYKFNRTLKDNAFSNVLDAQGNRIDPLAATETSTMRRPGSMGRSYFNPVTFTQETETYTDPDDPTKTITAPSFLGGAQMRTAEAAEAERIAEQQAAGEALLGVMSGGMDGTEAAAGVDTTGDFTGIITEDFINRYPNVGVDTTPTTPTTPTPSAYDLLMAGAEPSSDNIGTVVDAIRRGEATIPQVAGKFDAGTLDVAEDLLRNRGFTPPEVVKYMGREGLTEEELIVRLLDAGKTTPEEVAAYYSNDPKFEGITADQIRDNFNTNPRGFKDLTRKLAQGGALDSYYLGGPTDGMADLVPASIDGTQPAALSDGEFVVPADVVSHLGNGNSDAGAKQLYSMMDRVREARTGTTKQGTEIDPMQKLPA
tara:strand:+ start:637 stop:3327 length:2691 start_codon:yes stop_codon:yes gene_type:complete